MAHLYNEETISQAIDTKWAGKTVHFAKETDSTNSWIKRLAKDGAEHGTLAVAEFQSAGRGRFDRKEAFDLSKELEMKIEFQDVNRISDGKWEFAFKADGIFHIRCHVVRDILLRHSAIGVDNPDNHQEAAG